ncbi:hypothetical protein N5079_06660 [Planotetraspora sp. A-T 1434]|uniref:DUF2264 C-terminal domain-containing protein n=1 Tax=Planotetraspora sp. A-T 1434 TaxID=2979219 RepID=UPI0021BEDF6D|nr:hypothetical protein [Planotetraspora sp. A-T 1434]MCT9929899.1 hypothetical protein [Planotetraspora sp. A-T 1434]
MWSSWWRSGWPQPWHVRVHRQRTGRHLRSAEGGFAIDRGLPLDRRARLGMAGARGAAGLSAIHDLGAARAGEMVEALPGTNVMARRTFIPTLVAEHPPTEHLLVTAALGLVHDPSGGRPEPPATPNLTGDLL